jgi:parallel beta-helix repeat protein
MIKKTYLILLILLGPLPALVQVDTDWLRTCNARSELYYESSAKAVDRSGNVYVTGPSSEVLGEGQGFVTAKYDQASNLIWVVRYNDAAGNEDLTGSVTLDEIGNVRVRLANSKGDEVAIICYSPAGDQKWVRRYDNSAEGVSKKVGASPDLLRASNGLSYEEGWPVILSGGTNQNVKAADIDNDGNVEIVVSDYIPPVYGGSGEGHIYVFRHDGTLMEPWPNVDIDPDGLNPRAVSLGDLDNDGDLEIVFAAGDVPVSPDYRIYIFHHDGTRVTDGWPKTIGSFAPVSPTLEDIDNDGFLEIISKDGSDKISAWNFDGSDVPGWPFVLPGAGPLNYIAVGDVNCDGHKEFVTVQSNYVHHYIYIISNSGELLGSWGIIDDIFGVAATPALADLDKDGDLEILVYDCSKVHAYHHSGGYVNGWPVLADPSSYGGVPLSIADMDRDVKLEVTACAHLWQDGMSVRNSDGTLVEGWPVILNSVRFIYASSVGNIDIDDELEVLVTARNGSNSQYEIYAFNWNGTTVDDFPFIITDTRFGHVGNVVLQDTDQDDTVEAVFAAQTASPTNLFMVGVVNLQAPYDSLSLEWPMFQHDPRLTGLYSQGTIHVDDDNTAGPWDGTEQFPYRYVQDGIDNANPLNMILVHNGTCHENVWVNKPVYLVGQHKDSTIIDAGGGQAGVHLAADLVTVWGLTIQNSGESGIYVGSNYNAVLRSNISGNYYGVHIASPEGNRIYHNNFIDNQQNARDDFLSIWDDGYPSGGNYWDDYAGSDLYCGPNQDVPGSDGIGDTPYAISGGSNQDRYPLMNPWSGPIPNPPRDTVYVDDDFDQNTAGWGWNHFDNIQDAVDTVPPEGFVFVANGTYYENISIDKSINLVGENKDSSVIDGGANGDVIVLNRAQGVSLSGFTIRNGRYGVIASYETSNNTVSDNIVTDNEEVGVYLAFSCSSTISDNIIANTNTNGIYLHSSYDNIVSGNTVTGSEHGIILYHSSHNVVFGSTLRANEFGVYAQGSDSNQIYHNDFIDNTQNAYDNRGNTWDDGYPSGGNYWSDFDEPTEGAYDENSDGIADSAYDIPGDGGSQDRYPLMHPHNYVMHGDANGDWRISISDVVYLITYLFRDGPAPDPLEAGDANCDEAVNGEDVLYLINYLFRGGPPPTC